jgi:diketogulonate reductase-like aldo/keto reductase
MMSKTIKLPSGRSIPALGLGTWHMGEARSDRAAEAKALRAGIDLGLTLVDTAEMYASGGAEEVVAAATAGVRDQVYLVSKVLPQNATKAGTIQACEKSLKRLGTDRLDLYLLHWQGSHPLRGTIEAFERLKAQGKIAAWGVSNFDARDMAGLGAGCAANQVLYHAGSRGIEYDLLPLCQTSKIAVMAYCPLGQGDLVGNATMKALAAKHGVPPSAIALAWLLSKPGVAAIPKSARVERVAEFAKAYDVVLDAEDIAVIDRNFPPPKRKAALDIV